MLTVIAVLAWLLFAAFLIEGFREDRGPARRFDPELVRGMSILLPYLLIVALESTLFVWLSSRSWDEVTIAKMQRVVAAIPAWTENLKAINPSWATLVLAVACLLVFCVLRSPDDYAASGRAAVFARIVNRLRYYPKAVTIAAAALSFASCVKMFGDGVPDPNETLKIVMRDAQIDARKVVDYRLNQLVREVADELAAQIQSDSSPLPYIASYTRHAAAVAALGRDLEYRPSEERFRHPDAWAPFVERFADFGPGSSTRTPAGERGPPRTFTYHVDVYELTPKEIRAHLPEVTNEAGEVAAEITGAILEQLEKVLGDGPLFQFMYGALSELAKDAAKRLVEGRVAQRLVDHWHTTGKFGDGAGIRQTAMRIARDTVDHARSTGLWARFKARHGPAVDAESRKLKEASAALDRATELMASQETPVAPQGDALAGTLKAHGMDSVAEALRTERGDAAAVLTAAAAAALIKTLRDPDRNPAAHVADFQARARSVQERATPARTGTPSTVAPVRPPPTPARGRVIGGR